MFSSRARQERIEQARQGASAAKDSAAGAFLALDDAHKMTAALVEAYAQVEPGPKAQRVTSTLAPLLSASDRAAQDYIAALDQYDGVLTAQAPDVDTLVNAHRAFHDVYGRLESARQQIDQFRARNAELQDRLQDVHSRVQPAVNKATQALARARQAAGDARAAGIVSPDLDTRLARAEQLGQVAAGGAFRAGAQAAIDAAAELATAADDVVEAATRLQSLKTSGGGRLASSRTRLDGIAGRIPQVRETLSYLRRTYSLACSEDLDHVPETAERELEQARGLLAQVAAAQSSGDWDAAARHLEEGRGHLATAEEGVNGVVARRRDLDALAEDPAAELDRVRFVVRDAQRLVVSAGTRAPAAEPAILDGLMARLDAAAGRLEGTHPDYWSYLVELRAVRDVTAGVVRRTREAIAGA